MNSFEAQNMTFKGFNISCVVFLVYFLVWVEAQRSVSRVLVKDRCNGIYLNYQGQTPRITYPLTMNAKD